MRSIFTYLSALLVGSVLVGCVEKSGPDGPNAWQQGDTPYYVNLRLRTQSDMFTRADEEPAQNNNNKIDGTHEEHDICKTAGNFALFFDVDGKYISFANLYSVNEKPNDGETPDVWGDKHGHEDETEDTPQVEATYTCRFYGFANRQPAKVLVVVNAPVKIYDQLTDFPGWTLDEVMKQVWDESVDPYGNLGFYTTKTDGKMTRYFTMTNTTYIDRNGNLHCAEEIPEGSITTDEDEVEDLSPVTIYLERMVSKFSMSLNFNPDEYHPVSSQSLDVCKYENGVLTYSEAPWALQLLGWGLNGLETQNYLFKNVDKTGDWLGHPGWNSPAERRCYWSVDPHYDDLRVYPWQHDDAMDRYDLDHRDWYNDFHSYDEKDGSAQVNGGFALKYYPFKDFCPDVSDDGSFPEGYAYNTGIYYTPENTFMQGMQVDISRGTRAYELAGTHVLLCARLLLSDVNGGYSPCEKIYRNRVGVCYFDELSLLEDFMNAMNYKLTSQKYIYYKYYPWDEEKVSNGKKSYYGHTFRAVPSGTYALYYQDPDSGDYHELTSTILNDLLDDQQYRFVRPADAVNADGKIIPWIMYKEGGTNKDDDVDFEPLKLYILSKNADDNSNDDGETIFAKDYRTSALLEEYIRSRELKFEYFNGKDWTAFPNNFEDDNDTQSLFYEIWGVADFFRYGLMYYAVPIHAQEVSGNMASTPASGDITQLADMSAGFDDPKFYYYYGVVRNNWYNFTLHSIGDLGIPVFDVDKPIVPNYANKKDQVKVEMEILPMHVEDITVPIS